MSLSQFSKLIFFPALLASFLAINPYRASAGSYAISPSIIDLKLGQHEATSTTVSFENHSPAQMSFFVFVSNVGELPAGSDSRDSLVKWIEMPASVEVGPNGKGTTTISIQPYSLANPGIYHADIDFVPAYTQEEAEKNRDKGSTVTLNLEILKDSVERLELLGFNNSRSVYLSAPVTFNYSFKNTGGEPIAPSVHVSVYDKQGSEVAEILPAARGETVAAGATSAGSLVWKDGVSLGRYKAYFVADYGTSQPASLQDTVYFWVIPWQVFGLYLLGILLLLGFTHRVYGYARQEK